MVKERVNQVSALDGIEEQYYPQIFKLISSTVVLGNKKKYNTLEYLENRIMTSDVSALNKLGFPTNDPIKTEAIKKVLVKFIEISKGIRRDQWKLPTDPSKEEKFEARKHLTEEAIVDRNIRLMKKLYIGKDTARRFGVALSVEELKAMYKSDDEKRAAMVKKAMKDPAFQAFSKDFESVYKLGQPTKENTEVLYGLYEELKSGDNNSFGLKGPSLKAALDLVEKTIRVRRSTFDFNKERKNAKKEEPEASELQ